MDRDKQDTANEARNLAKASADAAADEAVDAVEARARIMEAAEEVSSSPAPTAVSSGATAPSTANPAAAPNTVPNPTAPTTAATVPPAATFVTQPTEVAPKKKTGKIIAIVILAILLLAGIGGAIWFFAFYNRPEKLALDAMTEALRAENIATESIADISLGGTATTISMNTVSSRNGTAQIDLTFDNSDLSAYDLSPLSLTAQLQQSRVYLQTDGVDDILTLLMYALLGGYNTEYYGDLYEDSTDEDESIDETIDDSTVYDYYDQLNEDATIGESTGIDGTWWLIDLAELGDYIGSVDSEQVTCLVDSVSKGELLDDYSAAYTAHPFLTASSFDDNSQTTLTAESGQQLIKVEIDADALAEFLYDFYNNSVARTIESCTGETVEQISLDKMRETTEDMVGKSSSLTVLKISTFGHHLTEIYAQASANDSTVTMTTKVNYPLEIDISEPQEYEDALEALSSLGLDGDELESLSETYLPGGLEV